LEKKKGKLHQQENYLTLLKDEERNGELGLTQNKLLYFSNQNNLKVIDKNSLKIENSLTVDFPQDSVVQSTNGYKLKGTLFSCDSKGSRLIFLHFFELEEEKKTEDKKEKEKDKKKMKLDVFNIDLSQKETEKILTLEKSFVYQKCIFYFLFFIFYFLFSFNFYFYSFLIFNLIFLLKKKKLNFENIFNIGALLQTE
jgi:hypothetical protein